MTIIPFPFLSLFFFFLFSFLFFVFFLDLATGRTPCHTLACLITLPALSVARGKKRIAPRAAPGPLPTAASPLPPTPARGTQLLPLPLPSILLHSVPSSCPAVPSGGTAQSAGFADSFSLGAILGPLWHGSAPPKCFQTPCHGLTANFMLFIYFFAFLFFLNPRELHRCTRSKL
jgi:hypothetical protein